MQELPGEHTQKDDSGEVYAGPEWFIAPIPIVSPALRTGLTLAAGRIYRLDRNDGKSPPTTTGVAIFGTNNKTKGIAGFHQMAFGQDKYRSQVLAGYGNVNYDFDVALTPETTVSLPLSVKGATVSGDFLRRLWGRWFAGPRYSLLQAKTSLRLNDTELPPLAPDTPELTLDIRTSGLGFRVMRDTRDSLFYPRTGTTLDLSRSFFRGGIGSDFDYEKVQAGFNAYREFGKRHVIAGRISACHAGGDVPFFDLCYLGKDQDLRGYRTGQFQDRALLSTQGEYRLELPWRLGLTAFAGVGQAAKTFGAFRGGGWLPGGGFGLRFLIAKKNHLNLRVDFAWGREGSAIYISAGEAF